MRYASLHLQSFINILLFVPKIYASFHTLSQPYTTYLYFYVISMKCIQFASPTLKLAVNLLGVNNEKKKENVPEPLQKQNFFCSCKKELIYSKWIPKEVKSCRKTYSSKKMLFPRYFSVTNPFFDLFTDHISSVGRYFENCTQPSFGTMKTSTVQNLLIKV